MSKFGVIRDATTGDTMTVNTEGRADVVQHAHVDSGTITFHVDAVGADTDYILIDISDTTNFPHSSTNYVHVEWLSIEIDGTTTPAADYVATIGYLENVDGTNGDFTAVEHLSGTRTTGTSKDEKYMFYPNGWKCNSSFHLCSASLISLNDAAFQDDADAHLATTIDPTSADTPSGNGDLVLRVDWTAGTLDIVIDIGYHTH